MFKTIKLNKGYWGKKLPFLKYGVPDPLQVFSDSNVKFSKAMAAFNFFGVFKTTKAGRHLETQKFLKKYIAGLQYEPVILDIGASDGTTSLQLIEMTDDFIRNYYVTDYNIKCTYIKKNRFTYFFNRSNECFLVASKRFVFYPENKKLFNFLFKKNLNTIKHQPKKELLLCNHDLQLKAASDPKIKIMAYNVFEPWTMEKPDIIVVGNLLHNTYFAHTEIYKALSNCYNALKDNGIIAIIRNTMLPAELEIELAVVYKKNPASGSFEQIQRINEGVEINDFVLSSKFK